jgi:hypothetical protein
MNAPQIVAICLMALQVGIGLADHGKPKTGNHSFFQALISTGLLLGLLIWGGFFK